jgi:hypothetical protein
MGGDQRADSVNIVISVLLFVAFGTLQWFEIRSNLRVFEVAGYPVISGLEAFLGTLSCMLPLMAYSSTSRSALTQMEKPKCALLAS